MADAGPPEERFCPTCGTEVDPEARFCPTCGAALVQDEELNLPPAPAWPPPETESTLEVAPAEAPPVAEPAAPDEEVAAAPPAPAEPPLAPPAAPPPGTTGAPGTEPATGADLPFSLPTLLSGWLIGVGSLAGAIALIPSLSNAVSLVLFVALLGVAATVFLAERLPTIPRLRLIVLCVTLVGLGVGFSRAGFGAQGISTILFLAMIAAAGGALLIELDRDRPLPPPDRPDAPREGEPADAPGDTPPDKPED